ncbi:unnamed protein product [Gemmata massiliana]|uniref:Uncharacterized protein n=1 Tax=Gemmata massiliana TaxID=1210884 RepID=A0A6P2D7N6_9BACT|nr:hypothetical protein [Gemmata massiliana]VTR96947.1 unnamed protein product [Gemmata massiliana]
MSQTILVCMILLGATGASKPVEAVKPPQHQIDGLENTEISIPEKAVVKFVLAKTPQGSRIEITINGLSIKATKARIRADDGTVIKLWINEHGLMCVDHMHIHEAPAPRLKK